MRRLSQKEARPRRGPRPGAVPRHKRGGLTVVYHSCVTTREAKALAKQVLKLQKEIKTCSTVLWAVKSVEHRKAAAKLAREVLR